MATYKIWAQLLQFKDTQLVWVKRDTRWDVYPSPEPTQLAAHNWEGWWLPLPDGRWFKAPTSFVIQRQAYTPDLRGTWVNDEGMQNFHPAD